MSRILLIVGFVFCFSLAAFSQNEEPVISTFSGRHGIPPLKIYHMTTDSSGYLWIGSNLGLHRFDGVAFKSYPEIPKTTIGDIEVDQEGKVYVALLQTGLAIYDQESDAFTLIEANEAIETALGMQMQILIREDDQLLLSQSGSGVFAFNKISEEFEPLLKKNYVNRIVEHPIEQNKILVVADSLYSFDLESKTLSLISPKRVLDLAVDDEENIWTKVYKEDGLSKMNLKDGGREFFPCGEGESRVSTNLVYNDDNIWFFSNNGLLKFDTRTKQCTEYYKDLGPLTALYIDEKDRIWFGAHNKLHVIDPSNQHFTLISGSKGNQYTSIAQISKDEFLLVPFYKNELHHLDLKTKKIRVEPLDVSQEFLKHPMDMVKIDDDVFIAYESCVARYHIPSRKLNPVNFDKYNEIFQNRWKKYFHADRTGKLWINVYSKGLLFKADPTSYTIDSMHYRTTLDGAYQALKVFENGEIYLISDKGFNKIDFSGAREKYYKYRKDGEETSLGFISSTMLDDEILWVVNNGKTYKGRIGESTIDLEEKTISGEFLDFSLTNDIVKASANEKLILTSAGVILFNEKSNENIFYGMKDGLDNIDGRSRVKVFDDVIFIISNGITVASNSAIGKLEAAPDVFVNSFEVNGENLIRMKDISLKASRNDVKIHFSSIDLSAPLDVKYKYRLSADEDWISADHNGNTVYLLDLKAGPYEFEVMAKHKHSKWSEIERVHFEIAQPLWKRWWFLLLILAVLGVLTYQFYKRKLDRSREMSEIKTRMAELENEALRAQMNPHFIFNSLNSIKSYIIDNEKEEAADYLTDFSDLIRLILANSREQLIPLDKELEALRLYMDIENVRLEDKFTYNINSDVKDVLIQPLTLQPFIENAIWHGFIHKKERGHLNISIQKIGKEILVEIEDDGIGRKRSSEIEKKHRRKRSFGIVITKERLGQRDKEDSIEIIDKENGSGTIVRIHIPDLENKNSI